VSRPDISMSRGEVDALLGRCDVLAMGTIGADGWPTATLARCSYHDGALRATVDPDDPIAGELARDGRVCCLADEHESYYEIRGVIAHGRATVHGGGAIDDDVDIHVDIHVDRVTSFDFGRLPH